MLAQPRRRTKGRAVSVAIAMMAAAGGCTPSQPPGTAVSAPLPPAHDVTVSGPAPRASAEILSATIVAGTLEAAVELEASAPLIWTSWRDTAGRVVVELPGASPGPAFTGAPPPEGLVTALEIATEMEGVRPLTRLVIATREESEHAVRAEGSELHIRLVAVSARYGAELANEPLGADVAAATRLDGVELLARPGGGAVVRLRGDGGFLYSTFALSDPPRVVVDLDGVVVRGARTTPTLEETIVERVAADQFRPLPRAVARVTISLRHPAVPVIEREPNGLRISFAGSPP